MLKADTDLFVEFPAGPLAVGEEPVRRVDEMQLPTGILRILSPTDCVKDRLAAFYHWDDRQSLEQALMVAEDNTVDIDEIRRWSEREGKPERFHQFRDMLSPKSP